MKKETAAYMHDLDFHDLDMRMTLHNCSLIDLESAIIKGFESEHEDTKVRKHSRIIRKIHSIFDAFTDFVRVRMSILAVVISHKISKIKARIKSLK